MIIYASIIATIYLVTMETKETVENAWLNIIIFLPIFGRIFGWW